ncbi:sulfotransferase family 2 domain-containing protein [Chitinophaga oryzae]|uniref:Sulfotransferase family 2 domain-containing protein n=1 Tax=Chitinophaga oryzae TaxID=2725414 RepID=A0ABX6LA80_9BACT|nr:sulfotransferase family 2 domain-containing protein [Chitinophaga oryzae]QJB36675.1 sulfotransferase family 2 domain-containing protein [Chitinophaga oryzae]
MKIPDGAVLPGLFMGNFFCLIPNTNFAFVVVSKNSCSFLKKVAIFNKTGDWMESVEQTHKTIGFTDKSGYLVPVNEIDNYEKENGKLIKFTVWRDPVERFVSTYKYFCIEKEYRTYFHYLNLHTDCGFGRFLEFATFELGKKDPLSQDEHIRRQSDFYSPGAVDHIVPISGLNDFLHRYSIPFRKERSNRTETRFEIDSKEHLDLIKELYKPDFAIQPSC